MNRRRAFPVLVAIGAVAAVVVPYLALGGATFEPTPVADPCLQRDRPDPSGLQAALEQVALSGLDGAACELGVTREELVLALRDEVALDAFADEHGIARADAEQAVKEGIERALADAEVADYVPEPVALLLRQALSLVPPWLLLRTLESVRGLLP